MDSHLFEGHHVVETCERCVGHVVAIVVGFVLMITGIALGVTIVLLPFGIPVGLSGLFLFLWGICIGAPKERQRRLQARRQKV